MSEENSLHKKYQELLRELSNPKLISNWEKLKELSQRKIRLEKIIEKEKLLEELNNKIKQNEQIIISEENTELKNLAQLENAEFKGEIKKLEEEISKLLKTDTKEEKQKARDIIIEIRAGQGGQEAALFTRDLYRMYQKYAASQSWRENILDVHPTELGGIKQIIFELSGKDVFSKLKYEGGVHRVQRVPSTEKNNRIHTSTVTVAILPKVETSQVSINPKDLKVEYFKSSGPGGQNVNKRQTAVRILHIPSGIVVSSQATRHLEQNKENAFKILRAKLLKKEKQEKELKTDEKRRKQIKGAKRPEKIRTYNFPQDRVTDHRIKKSWHNLQKIMEGNLNPIIEELKRQLEK
ncbi:peptide chain release factor 1 [bacterium]|nr:peptide chain release factor 1 [bacterium]